MTPPPSPRAVRPGRGGGEGCMAVLLLLRRLRWLRSAQCSFQSLLGRDVQFAPKNLSIASRLSDFTRGDSEPPALFCPFCPGRCSPPLSPATGNLLPALPAILLSLSPPAAPLTAPSVSPACIIFHQRPLRAATTMTEATVSMFLLISSATRGRVIGAVVTMRDSEVLM